MKMEAELIEKIYEAGVVVERWPAILAEISTKVDAAGMVLLATGAERWAGAWTGVIASPSIEAPFAEYLHDNVPSRTMATPRLLAADRAGFVINDEIFSREEWLIDPHHADWSSRFGYEHAMATAVLVPSGERLVFHLERFADRPVFGAREVAMLDRLRPHLARAGMLTASLQMERFRAATDALALIGLPALILSDTGHVLAANELIQGMPDYLRWLPRNGVAIIDATANALFRQAVANISNVGPKTVRSFPARSAARDNPVVLHVVPTSGVARDVFGGSTALLVATAVTAGSAPETTLIRGLFDLTASEARVASGIAQGLSVEELAAAGNVSRATVRTQLKSIYVKMGCNRQSEVASVLAGLRGMPMTFQPAADF